LTTVAATVHGKVGKGGTTEDRARDHATALPPIGKRTLVEAVPTPALGGAWVQRKGETAAPLEVQHPAIQRSQTTIGAGSGPIVTPPAAGIDKTGFIDRRDGANLHTDPVGTADALVRDKPLPPATRVFVSGTHPRGADWWYVTAFLPDAIVRGYVQGFRVNTRLPEPLAELHLVADGETAEGHAKQKFSGAASDGHDLRYYENVLLRVNQDRHPPGVRGSYQDPGLLGGGSNNVQLVAGELIWLVSAPYARSLQSTMPSGSLTGAPSPRPGASSATSRTSSAASPNRASTSARLPASTPRRSATTSPRLLASSPRSSWPRQPRPSSLPPRPASVRSPRS
jgi:hypothetical protein